MDLITNKIQESHTMESEAIVNSSETSELFNVPEEVLITILGKLKLPELLSILLVNKFLNELVLSTSRLNSKLVLYFGECWCTGPKKALLNDMFDAGRSFERIKLQGIRGDNYWQRSSAIQIVVIIRKHGMNIKSLEVDNCAFNQTMLIELLEAMPQVNSVTLTNNSPYDVEQNCVHELNTPPADALRFNHLMHLNATNNSEYHIAHIFQHATHLKSFIIDHQNVPFIKNQTDLKELKIPPKSDFFSDEIQKDVKFQLELLEVDSMDNWMDIGNRENILKFLEKQLRINTLIYNLIIIGNDLKKIISLKNVKKLSLMVQRASEETLEMRNPNVLELHLRCGLDYWTRENGQSFIKIFPNLQKLQLELRQDHNIKPPDKDFSLEGLDNLKEVEIEEISSLMLKYLNLGSALTKITIASEKMITVEDFALFAARNHNIRELKISRISGSQFLTTFGSLKNLETLSIDIDTIDVEDFKALPNLKFLKELNITIRHFKDEELHKNILKMFEEHDLKLKLEYY